MSRSIIHHVVLLVLAASFAWCVSALFRASRLDKRRPLALSVFQSV